MSVHESCSPSERHTRIVDMHPGPNVLACRELRDHCYRSTLDRLQNKIIPIGFITADRYENRSRVTTARIMSDIDYFGFEAANRAYSPHFVCQNSQLQFVLPALLCGGSPPDDDVLIAVSLSIFLGVSLESLTRQVVC